MDYIEDIELPVVTLPLRIVLDWLLPDTEEKPEDVKIMTTLVRQAAREAGYVSFQEAFDSLATVHGLVDSVMAFLSEQ